MGGSSNKVTVGYKYYAGMHQVLCHGPIDLVRDIRVDKRIATDGTPIAEGTVNINKPELFGGESREGGVSGNVDLDFGGPSQTVNSYLSSVLTSPIPAFRGVVSAVLNQCYLGNNPYLKPWEFRCQRIHTAQDGAEQWYDEKAEIGGVFLESQAFYIAADYSGSMFPDRILSLIAGLKSALDKINSIRKNSSVNVSIAIRTFGGDTRPGNYIGRYDVSDSDIESLKSFLDDEYTLGLMATDWGLAFSDLSAFFNGVPESYKKRIVMATDGEPGAPSKTAQQIVDEALVYLASYQGIPVYVGQIELTSTTYSSQIDTTSDDGIPIIQDDADDIESLFLWGITSNPDMNPAHIIRECLTNPDWGMGYNSSDISSSSFTAAADQLFDENFGLSLLWDKQVPIEDFVQDVLRHIDAALRINRQTGQFELKLIRDDYAVSNLLLLDELSVVSVENFKTPSALEVINSVNVNYWNPETGENSSVNASSAAGAQLASEVISATINYDGITNAPLASRVADRDLLAGSSPLISATIIADRTASELSVGDPFLFSWEDLKISNKVMRVNKISFGDGIKNRIRIDCIEDVFSLSETFQVATPESGLWVDPTTVEPQASDVVLAEESPYYELVVSQGQTAVDNLLADTPTSGYALVAASRPSVATSINAPFHIDSGAGYSEGGVLNFSPYCYLAEDLGYTTKTVAISGLVDSDLIETPARAWIGGEYVVITAITSSSMTIGRAILDTVPAQHSNGDPVLILDGFSESDEVEYLDGESINVKVTPATGAGSIDLSLVTAETITFGSRAIRPYPPGDFQINSFYYPEAIEGGLSISWAHRDRSQQTSGNYYDFEEADIGPEANQTYNLRIYNENDNLLREEAGLTSTLYEYTTATESIDEGASADPDWANVSFLANFNSLPLVDSGPVGHTITNSGVTINSSLPKFGLGCGEFSSAYCYIPSSSWNFGTGDYRVQAWVRPTSIPGGGVNNDMFVLGSFNASPDCVFFLRNSDLAPARWDGTTQKTSSIQCTVNAWNFVEWSRTSGTFRIFVNGVKGFEGADSVNHVNATSAYLGRNDAAVNRYFIGQIDDLIIYKNVGGNTSDYTPPTVERSENQGLSRINGLLRVELESERDAYTSFQKYDYTINRAGYGLQYGRYYGGLE